VTATVTSTITGYQGAVLDLAIDPAEDERRQAFRRRHIESPDILDLLMSLPVGEPVPYQNLSVHQQDTVRRAPAGALRVSKSHMVTRFAVRPCRIKTATVRHATACQTALCSAARFAPFCTRQVIVRHRPKMPETLIEYDFWGVGLLLDHGDGATEVLVAPEPWRARRHTVAGWRFAELAYGTYLEQAQGAGAAS
jgi:hypothetical protein